MNNFYSNRKFKIDLKYLIGFFYVKFNQLLSKCVGHYYKKKMVSCGEDVLIYPGVSINLPEKISIGSHTHLGERCHLRGGGRLIIGEWCQIANHVIVATGNHPINGERYYGNVVCRDVVIGNNVWIASGAIILPGVTIGDNSVIAAGSVVSRSIDKNSIVAGIPAKIIGNVPNQSNEFKRDLSDKLEEE